MMVILNQHITEANRLQELGLMYIVVPKWDLWASAKVSTQRGTQRSHIQEKQKDIFWHHHMMTGVLQKAIPPLRLANAFVELDLTLNLWRSAICSNEILLVVTLILRPLNSFSSQKYNYLSKCQWLPFPDFASICHYHYYIKQFWQFLCGVK